MTDFAWAIVGPGRIAHRFAEAIYHLPGHTCAACSVAVDGRVGEFVADWSRPGKPPPRAVPDLDALLRDSSIDAVYVATPHSSHAAFIRACLLAGKPVLCEKPWFPTLPWRANSWRWPRERRVFLMEAIWTRFCRSMHGCAIG